MSSAMGRFRRYGWLGGLPVAALLLLFWSGTARALEARALVDRDTISRNDVLGFIVVVTDGDGTVDTSPIEDFVVADRGRTSSVQIVNTRMTREVRYRFALTPRRSGTLVVPALTVGEGREAAVTDPITVRVLEPGAAASVADVAVEAEVSDATPFVGQEIVYTFRLLAATQIADAGYQAPEFDGFTVVPLDDQRRYRTVRNGRELSVTELAYLLVPLRTGELVIEPAPLSCRVPVGATPSQRREPFGVFDNPFLRRSAMQEKSLTSESLTLQVSALPPPPPGAPFSGLVGHFSLSAAVSPSAIPAGESATVTLILEGTGNVPEAAAPELGAPAGFKVYPDAPEAEITRDVGGTRGSKRFQFALVPSEPGKFELGPFRLLTFDPEQGSYRPLQAGPLQLTVEPGAASAPLALAAPGPQTDGMEFLPRREVVRRGHDILDIYAGLDAAQSRQPVGVVVVLSAVAVPPLLYLAVWAVTARRSRTRSVAEEMLARAGRELAEAKRLGAAGKGDGLAALRRALLSAVFAAAGRSGEALTGDEAHRLLGEAGVGEEQAAEVRSLLGRIDAAQYGGDGDDAELVGTVQRALQSLAREVKA